MESFKDYVGGLSSAHDIGRQDCEEFYNQRGSVEHKLNSYSKDSEIAYKICLIASLNCARYLITQAKAFDGRDESSTSINKANFRELVEWYKYKRVDVKRRLNLSVVAIL